MPTVLPVSTLTEREARNFWAKVDKSSSCWLWTASKVNGYGSVFLRGRARLAHRIAWTDAGNTIPDGKVLDHQCFNRACVNPAHLVVVTRGQNNQNLARARKDCISGERGVYRRGNRWGARAQINGKFVYGGMHATKDEAVKAASELRRSVGMHASKLYPNGL